MPKELRKTLIDTYITNWALQMSIFLLFGVSRRSILMSRVVFINPMKINDV